MAALTIAPGLAGRWFGVGPDARADQCEQGGDLAAEAGEDILAVEDVADLEALRRCRPRG